MRISINKNNICFRNYEVFSVIYDLKGKKIFLLENVSSDIFDYIYQYVNVSDNDIETQITKLYDCTIEEIHTDVHDFIIELFNEGIIEIENLHIFYPEISEKTNLSECDIESEVIDLLQPLNQIYSVTIEITYACNEKCIHCYANYPESSDSSLIISKSKYRQLIDELFNLKCMHIAFTGGDPFMYKDFLEIYLYARSKGFICDIFTNGLYLSNHYELIETFANSNPRAFFISVYGSTSQTHDKVTSISGSFSKTIETIRLLKSSGVSVVLNIMILSVNYFDIEDIIKLAKNLGVEYRVSMSLIYKNDGSSKPMDYFIFDKAILHKVLNIVQDSLFVLDKKVFVQKKDNDYMCGAGITSLSISPDGNVFPCVSLKQVLGNINNESIEQIWKGSKRKKFINLLKWENATECNQCQNKLFCSHCAGISQAETGNMLLCNTCDKTISECMASLND